MHPQHFFDQQQNKRWLEINLKFENICLKYKDLLILLVFLPKSDHTEFKDPTRQKIVICCQVDLQCPI